MADFETPQHHPLTLTEASKQSVAAVEIHNKTVLEVVVDAEVTAVDGAEGRPPALARVADVAGGEIKIFLVDGIERRPLAGESVAPWVATLAVGAFVVGIVVAGVQGRPLTADVAVVAVVVQ